MRRELRSALWNRKLPLRVPEKAAQRPYGYVNEKPIVSLLILFLICILGVAGTACYFGFMTIGRCERAISLPSLAHS
jgi:hypothetical protein